MLLNLEFNTDPMSTQLIHRSAFAILIAFLLPTAFSFAQSPAPSKPNLVLIMGDDMGYSDIGCYGGEIQTPVLDSLAESGIRLTQFYNTSRCCPTRASLLTGLYSHQAGIGLMTGDRGVDSYRGELNKQCVTLAEALGNAGYRNYMSGKWHVTGQVAPDGDKKCWPLQRGFDQFYGTITGAGSFYDPATLCRGNQFITPENDEAYQPESFYYTDAINDNAITYLQDHFKQHQDQPFFLYVSYTSAHWPMHAPESVVKKYDGVYDGGFDPARAKRYERAKLLGVIDPAWKMSASDVDWTENKHKEWDIRCMEVYAAMVDRMDQGIGRIVAELKQQNAFDNTLIVFLQDNGGCAEGFGRRSNAEKIAGKTFPPLGKDGLQTKIWPPMQTRDGRPARTGPEIMPGGADTFVGYGRGWANVSNTPFRGYKHDGFEGGISSPLIMHWPAGTAPEQRNSIVDSPSHLIDIMPTFLSLATGKYPTTYQTNQIKPMEGVSLQPLFTGQPIVRPSPIGFEHHGNLALRDGRWKIVSAYQAKQPRRWHLYDMQSDRTEQVDLGTQHPERLTKMVNQWQTWADRVGVQTWPFKNKQNMSQ
ncbi:MAG: arylsulfatase A-like enzyme [Mariniblastus sp.]|jgi:arylsulfatase A-like enzyme